MWESTLSYNHIIKRKKTADATNGIFSYKLYNYYCPNMQAYKEMEIPTYIKLEI